MSDMAVQYFALVQASMARIEGMKAENIIRLDQGKTIAYGSEAFFEEAKQLEQYADQIRGQRA